MKKTVFLFIAMFVMASLSISAEAIEVNGLKVNRMTESAGIIDKQPMLSWVLTSKQRNTVQTAYQIEVTQGKEVVWQTGKIISDCSIGVPYQGKELKGGTRYSWRVKIWDNHGHSVWSKPSSWLTGLIDKSVLQAKWIEPDDDSMRLAQPSPLMRKTFRINKPIASAVVFITSHGMNEAYLNGKKIGDCHYAPGWTAYAKRLQYYTFDVTSMLHQGDNAFGMMLGKGWMLSPITWNRTYPYKNLTSSVGALAQMIITFSDGSTQTVMTDGSWKYAAGEVRQSSIYDGETVDANKIQNGWNTTSFNDGAWKNVRVADYDNANLVNCESEPVVTRQMVKPVKVFTTPKGEKVIDFGQNLVGREIITVRGTKGQQITVRHAEVLDEKGNFYTHNLRSAKATSRFVCSGGNDVFEPCFTFYGFRYIMVDGWNGELTPENFTAAVVYSGFDDNGTFKCSNDTINQLQSNIRWGMHGNYVDIPTDCPQRDERLGWMGDAHVFFRTATFNGRVENFFRKWLQDISADQVSDGRVPDVIPNVLDKNTSGRTGWADAATIIPWQHYLAYGDKQILINQYACMKGWVDYMSDQSKDDLWTTGWHYGDWLAFDVDNDLDGTSSVTSKRLIQQCFFAHSAELVAKTAEVLGKEDDAKKYRDLSDRAKQAFQDAYMTKRGNLMSDTQTAYVLALNFDMLPENMRPVAAQRLAQLVKDYGHITTGFLGTPYICHILTMTGHSDLAYQLLLHKQYPGWLYPVLMGATTIWERWNSMLPDHTIPDNGMNSFNHYSYGAIGDWLYRDAVGMQETSPAFKTIRIQPHIGGGFTNMSASENTPYGPLAASWCTDSGLLKMDVTIPVNTTAEVYVPAEATNSVRMDGKTVRNATLADGYIQFKLGSGTYHFISTYRK